MTESGIRKKIAATVAAMSATGPILKGNISRGKTGHQITWKGEDQKSKTLYVPDARLEEAQAMTKAYKQAKSLLEKLADLNAQLYKITAK
ncbi:MAG: hypothetical protein AAB214_15870 [Fibrobacterota bacterium]